MTDMDHLISVALQHIGCLSITLKAEQRACIKSVYNFPLATINICTTKQARQSSPVLVVSPLASPTKLVHLHINGNLIH